MGRTKKLTDPGGTPRPAGPGGDHTIRSYLHPTTRAQSPQPEMEAANQAPDSIPSTPARHSPALSYASEPQMLQEDGWRDILPNLLTKTDFEALSDRLGRVVREEVAQLRADMVNMEARMSVAEAETKALRTDLEHTNTAVTGQEADMAYLTTWIDDLDNRGRRLNLRVRGVREGGPSENIPDTLRQIFTQVLGARQGPDQITLRKSEEVPSFLRTLGLPPIQVPDWLTRSFLQQPPGPQQPRRQDLNPQGPQHQRRRDWNQGQARRER
ncbi:Hypothetical predicted protein [Pelobates cultripes]|uniref:Uncharacterized protein n=1 Tax=Pelobates cultripes TaxID=61616 RepID=A0AAD1RGS8_PELCU|nr:Hypothetical predicted protein [Pelobates cultripes]